MAPYLLRSAVAILRRPTPPSTFRRRSPIDSSRFFASGGAARVEPAKAYCVGCMRMESALEKHSENLYRMEKDIGVLLEHQRRFERSEQFHKRLSCVLIPGAIAFFVFCPDKKREPSTEGQSGV